MLMGFNPGVPATLKMRPECGASVNETRGNDFDSIRAPDSGAPSAPATRYAGAIRTSVAHVSPSEHLQSRRRDATRGGNIVFQHVPHEGTSS
jgi:hypothetical protein